MEQDQNVQKSGWLKIALVGRNPKRTMARALLLAVACLVTFRFVLLPIRVEGISMLPTYKDRSFNLINRLAYRQHGPNRGDVVSIRTAGISLMYLKRVVALPGETVEFRGGQLVVNGIPFPEPWLKFRSSWTLPARTLGLDEFYVVGDNRTMPPTNHTQGAATLDRIVGKVLL